MDWELGEKADPFAPAYPGIKPEWYFLWEYQLLKEFPPHLFGLEGPQVCLFIIAILLGIWAIIPWLDRRAYRNLTSPAFSDFGWAAILFLTYLTLMGWDIGAHGAAEGPAALQKIAHVCALWTLAAGAVVVLVRVWRYQHRWFLLTGAALLQVILHGLLGLSYLVAGTISSRSRFFPDRCALFSWAKSNMKTISILAGLVLFSTIAVGADENAVKPSAKLAAMLDAKDESGKPIITAEQKAYYDGLNDNLREMLNQRRRKGNNFARGALIHPAGLAIASAENGSASGKQLHPLPQRFREPFRRYPLYSESGPTASHMDLRQVVEDVHFRRGVSCAGCHGGDPTADLGHDHVKEWPEKDRDKNRAWVVQFCARCHSDPAMMHEFNPALPTDQLAKFKDSPHGHRLARSARRPGAFLRSCHGVHGIRPAKDPQSKVYARRIPETCGACHANPDDHGRDHQAQMARLCRQISWRSIARAFTATPCSIAAISARRAATPATGITRPRHPASPA